MYKHEGSYYLMAAEGGTGVNHSVVIAIGVLVGWVVGSAVNGSHRMSIEKLESWKFQEQWGTMGNMESIPSSNIFVLFLGRFLLGRCSVHLHGVGFFHVRKKSVLLKESHGPCVYSKPRDSCSLVGTFSPSPQLWNLIQQPAVPVQLSAA